MIEKQCVGSSGSVYLLYHFFHPDDVVSARLYADLAEELTEAGFEVTALPCNRSCHDASIKLSRHQSWAGGKIRRVWRPNWPQHKTLGRFGNALCMLLGWTWRALVTPRRRDEVVIIGTDPVLAVLIAITWRLFRPKSKIIHWCHDVYPQAAVAEGMIRQNAPAVRLLNFLLRIAYRRCDVIVDLGICMRRLLQQAAGDVVAPLWVDRYAMEIPNAVLEQAQAVQVDDWLARCWAEDEQAAAADALALRVDGGSAGPVKQRTLRVNEPSPLDLPNSEPEWRSGRYATLVPWSLVEPAELLRPDAEVRDELFGDCRLGLLYSGNFGRAHGFDAVLTLARRLRGEQTSFCFAGRGPRLEAVQSAVTTDDRNIHFAGFADESRLAARLAAADIHLVTLRQSWTGAVIPSKFFGALAAGRPVLFAGSADSALAHWIEDYGVGWRLDDQTVDDVADELRRLARDPLRQGDLQQHCFDVYHSQFSRRVQISRWLQVIGGGAEGQSRRRAGGQAVREQDRSVLAALCSDRGQRWSIAPPIEQEQP